MSTDVMYFLIYFWQEVEAMEFHERLKAARIDLDKTQAELAAALRIPQQQYSRYERGLNELPLLYLGPICAALGVSADYLLGLPKGLAWPR